MKIGILSDIHSKTQNLDFVLELFKKNHIQYLICAGDIEQQKHLQQIKDMQLPYISVFGNNDYNLLNLSDSYNIYKEPYYFKIQNTTFKLMHLPYYMSGDTDVVIFGHTHKFETNYINHTLFINPGEVCAREKDLIECVILDIEDEYKISYFYTNLQNIKWQHKDYVYKMEQ